MLELELLQNLNKQLFEMHSQLIESARLQIDKYWIYLIEANTVLSERFHRGEITKDTGPHVNRIAPVIEARGNAHKPGEYALAKTYIIWKKHSLRFRKNLKSKSTPSISIHSYSLDDVSHILTRHCTWNAERALMLEQNLVPIRVALNGLHEQIKKNNATIRKLNKLTTTEKDHD